jgi:hypothetical protein
MKQSFSIYNLELFANRKPYYIQLPITVLYKFEAGSGLSLYPLAGFYLGYGIGGRIKNTGNIETSDLVFFNEFTNRFDAGLTFGFNVEHSNIVIGLGYDLGLLKINKIDLEGALLNRNMKVTLGYFF